MTVVTLCLGAAGGNARVRLLPGEYSLGRRAQDVDIVPYDDKSVSRKHAVIRVTTFPPGSVTDLDASLRVELRDDSSLGTLVNRERLPKGVFVAIHHNDVLQFGTAGGDTVCRLDVQPVVYCVATCSPGDDLRVDVLTHIFNFLDGDIGSLCRCACVSTTWRMASRNPLAWRTFSLGGARSRLAACFPPALVDRLGMQFRSVEKLDLSGALKLGDECLLRLLARDNFPGLRDFALEAPYLKRRKMLYTFQGLERALEGRKLDRLSVRGCPPETAPPSDESPFDKALVTQQLVRRLLKFVNAPERKEGEEFDESEDYFSERWEDPEGRGLNVFTGCEACSRLLQQPDFLSCPGAAVKLRRGQAERDECEVAWCVYCQSELQQKGMLEIVIGGGRDECMCTECFCEEVRADGRSGSESWS